MDAALARIEHAVQRTEPGDAALRARHEQLKAAVARSLGQLDELIASQDR